MFRFTRYAWLIALAAGFASSCTTRAGDRPTTRPVVVVELFTSEGCSSCPPADVLLGELATPDAIDGVEIIPLALHVDYWNRLGWVDRFSSPAWSDRQQRYARIFNADQVYTPQMIVDGTDPFVGSDRPSAIAAIARAAARAKGRIVIDVAAHDDVAHGPARGNSLTCKISVADVCGAGTAGARVMLAVTEDDLSTDVRRGENAGRALRHTAVVRALEPVATIRSADPLPFTTSAELPLDPAWRADHLHVVAFVQDPATGQILAATRQAFAARKATP